MSSASDAGVDSRYRVSLEKQLDWLRWSRSSEGDKAWRAVELTEAIETQGRIVNSTRLSRASSYGMDTERPAYERVLEQGTLYHVTSHFCQLVDYARRTTPPTTTFDQRWMLSPYGFVWLDEPFDMPMIQGQLNTELTHSGALGPKDAPVDDFRLAGRAIGWEPIPEGNPILTADETGHRVIREAGPGTYRFFLYQEGVAARIRDADGLPRVLLPDPTYSGGFWPLSYFYVQHGQPLSERLLEFEEVAKLDDKMATYLPAPGETWRHEIQYVYTLLALMAQRVAVIRDTELDRPARRGFERRGLAAPTHLKAITLRRERDYLRRDDPSKGSGRHVTIQFVVQGFWRHFPYRPTCDECVSRKAGCGGHPSIWIEPFTKGPPGAPFKDNDQRVVFVARR